MPKQSRGFWNCEYCGTSFDRFEEAHYHEQTECTAAPPPYASHSYSPPPTASHLQQQQQQQQPHLPQYQHHHPPPPSHQPYPHPHQPTPYAETPHSRREMAPYEAATEHFPAGFFEFTQKSRRFPLFDIDGSHLAEADVVACRHLELFETSTEETTHATGYQRAQIGLRCLLCANTSESSVGSEFSLPRAVSSLGDAVRRLADHHLSVCDKIQPHDRWILEHAARTRQSTKEEGGPSWHEDESNRRALIDYCTDRCHRLGIIDKEPYNSGIEFRESPFENQDTFDASPIGTPQQMSALEPSSLSRPPLPQVTDTISHHSSIRMPPLHQVDYPPSPVPSPYLPHEAMHPRAIGPPAGMAPVSATMQSTHISHPAQAPYYRASHYDVPVSFPFFQDPNEGDWICKFCSHVHPTYRDPHYRWTCPGNTPPPPDFIDHHLSLCRSFHHVNQSHLMASPHNHPTQMHAYSPLQTSPYAQNQAAASPYASQPLPWESASHSSVGMLHPSTATDSPIPASSTRSSYSNPSASVDVGGNQIFQPQHMPSHATREDPAVGHAMDFLNKNDKSILRDDGTVIDEPDRLVRDEDKLLLTDFLFYLMKQLRLARFSESDRKTRGGKRERIQVGFGGLECVHCAHIKKSRKFFWSGVDRLANSFAEIPTHVFKCKYCPQPMKDALTTLKSLHPEQMARLPRGSQKVFFRRVWKRIHEDDPNPEPPSTPTTNPKPPPIPSLEASRAPAPAGPVSSSADAKKEESPDTKHSSPSEKTIGSNESILFLDRPTKEAAKALADSAMQAGPPSPSSRILLAIAEDRDFLSDTDCFIRRQLEVFCAVKEDVRTAQDDRKFPIHEGQVGIRCIYCSMSRAGARGHAVAYPFSISGIFESVREFQRLHLEYCENSPPNVKSKLANLKESTTITSIQRRYYTLAAKGLGLFDAKDGIRAGSESIPVVSQAVFSFPETAAIKEEPSESPNYGKPPTPALGKFDRTTSQHSSTGSSTASRKRSLDSEQRVASPKKPPTPSSSNYTPPRPNS